MLVKWSMANCSSWPGNRIYTKMLLFALSISSRNARTGKMKGNNSTLLPVSVTVKQDTDREEKHNTSAGFALRFFFFYIALIETSNLELILGGAPRRCNWYACKSMCCRTHCTAYFFLIKFTEKETKKYTYENKGVKSHSLTIHWFVTSIPAVAKYWNVRV